MDVILESKINMTTIFKELLILYINEDNLIFIIIIS